MPIFRAVALYVHCIKWTAGVSRCDSPAPPKRRSQKRRGWNDAAQKDGRKMSYPSPLKKKLNKIVEIDETEVPSNIKMDVWGCLQFGYFIILSH